MTQAKTQAKPKAKTQAKTQGTLPRGALLRHRVERHLAAFTRIPHQDPSLRRAAVAIVLLEAPEDDATCFLITRRAGGLRRHGGQWALPGGRLDEGEDARAAALRELHEEVGLALPEDRILGLLDDYPTRSGFSITPVVVWGGEVATLAPDPREVRAVYRVPVADLDGPGVPRLRHIPESDRPVLSVAIRSLDTEVFAPTAAVLYQMREVAIHGRPTRVAQYDQPVFAWR